MELSCSNIFWEGGLSYRTGYQVGGSRRLSTGTTRNERLEKREAVPVNEQDTLSASKTMRKLAGQGEEMGWEQKKRK